MKKILTLFCTVASTLALAEMTPVRIFLNSDSYDSNHALYLVPSTFKNLPNLGYLTAKFIETNGSQEVQGYFGVPLTDCPKGGGYVYKFRPTDNSWEVATAWQDGRSKFGDSMAVSLCNLAFKQGLYSIKR